MATALSALTGLAAPAASLTVLDAGTLDALEIDRVLGLADAAKSTNTRRA